MGTTVCCSSFPLILRLFWPFFFLSTKNTLQAKPKHEANQIHAQSRVYERENENQITNLEHEANLKRCKQRKI